MYVANMEIKTAEILFIENPSKVILNEDINIKSPIKYNKPKGFLQKLFKK